MLTPMLAYLDPGTGSFLLQMAVAGLLSSFYVAGQSWNWVKIHAGRMVRHDD